MDWNLCVLLFYLNGNSNEHAKCKTTKWIHIYIYLENVGMGETSNNNSENEKTIWWNELRQQQKRHRTILWNYNKNQVWELTYDQKKLRIKLRHIKLTLSFTRSRTSFEPSKKAHTKSIKALNVCKGGT